MQAVHSGKPVVSARLEAVGQRIARAAAGATGISSKPEWWDWPANNLGFQAAHDILYAPEDADGVKKVVHSIPGYENRTVVVLNSP